MGFNILKTIVIYEVACHKSQLALVFMFCFLGGNSFRNIPLVNLKCSFSWLVPDPADAKAKDSSAVTSVQRCSAGFCSERCKK